MYDYCHVCGCSLTPVEINDCPRCANVEKQLTPEVMEWIRDVVETAITQHKETSNHPVSEYD